MWTKKGGFHNVEKSFKKRLPPDERSYFAGESIVCNPRSLDDYDGVEGIHDNDLDASSRDEMCFLDPGETIGDPIPLDTFARRYG